ncbi:MAG: hypothetical protein E7406_00030 [Ruminococcaceae bacterium]|nr:hypothetical protein [Oscillospiraceae bacterium]
MKDAMYIRETETISGYGDRIVLYYFTNEKRILTLEGEIIRYGVGIAMYTQLPGERTKRERKVMEGIFRTKEEAEEFVDVLCRGLVTPITLEDIVADNVV